MARSSSLSSLSDGILRHIFSFVDMKYAVQSSVLSTRWRYVWKYLPNLNFDSREFFEWENFMKFIDKVLRDRDTNSDIQKFCLYIHELPEHIPLPSWISAAVQSNATEVNITVDVDPYSYTYELRLERRLALPISLFSSNSLQVLRVNFPPLAYLLCLPEQISLPSLKILDITSILNVDENFITKLFSGSPLLERLTINGGALGAGRRLLLAPAVVQVFNINAPNLKHLALKFLFDRENIEDYYSHNFKFDIYAPNLISFKYENNILTAFNLQNSSSLQEAHIDISIVPEVSHYSDPIPDDRATMIHLYRKRIITCLRGVSNVKHLTLSASLLEFISESVAVLLPKQFCNLQYLKLVACLSSDSIRAIMHLLKISPIVETLVLTLTKCPGGHHIIQPYLDEGDYNSTSVFNTFLVTLPSIVEYQNKGLSLRHLKFVEMQHALCSINELKFMEILVKAALVAEKIVFFTSESVDSKQMIKFKEKLLTFPRASSLAFSFFPDSQ